MQVQSRSILGGGRRLCRRWLRSEPLVRHVSRAPSGPSDTDPCSLHLSSWTGTGTSWLQSKEARMRSTGAAAPACLLPAATRLRPTWAQNQTSPAASCFDGRLGLLLDAGFGMKMNAALAFEKYIIAAQVPCSNVRAASVCRQHRGLRSSVPNGTRAPRRRPWPSGC
jgi:hypothetical protein